MNSPMSPRRVHIIIACLLVIVCSVMVLIRNESFQRYAARKIVGILSTKTGWDISFNKIIWRPLSGAEIRGVALYTQGKQAFSARRVELSYTLSWKKPFIVPGTVYIDSPLIVGDMDENGRIANFPMVLKNDDGSKNSKTLFDIPVPDVEIDGGRIVAIQNGCVKVALKSVSARVKVSVGKREDGERVFRVRVFNGSFFAEKPFLESFQWNGVVIISKDGVNLKNFSVFSSMWGILTGAGFWDNQKNRGFFRFSLDGFDLYNIAFVPVNIKKYTGVVSANAELILTPSSVHAEYLIEDSRLGKIKGTMQVSRDDDGVFRIGNKAYFTFVYSFDDASSVRFSSVGLLSVRLQGAVDAELTISRKEDLSGTVSVSLGDSELVMGSGRRISLDRGIVRFGFRRGFLEIEKANLIGIFGKFIGRGMAKWEDEFSALAEWKLVKGEKEKSGVSYSTFRNGYGKNTNDFLDKLLTKVLSLPVNETSGIVNFHCGDSECGDIRSIRVSGKATFSSQGNLISVEGATVGNSGLNAANLTFLFRSEKLSEWSAFLNLPVDVDGLCQIEGNVNNSPQGIQFRLKSIFEKAHIDQVLVKRFYSESGGWVRSCLSRGLVRKKDETLCNGFAVGNAVYFLDQTTRVTVEGVQKVNDKRLTSGEVTVAQQNDQLKIVGSFNTGDISGSLNATAKDIWRVPSFSVTESYVSVPGIGKVVFALHGLLKNGTVDVASLVISKDNQNIAGAFKVDRSGKVEGKFKGNNIKLAEDIGRLKGVKVSGGLLGGDIVLRGSLEAPTILTQIEVQSGAVSWRRSNSVSWDRLKITATLDRGILSADVTLEFPGIKEPVKAIARLPIKLSFKPFDMIVYRDKPFSADLSVSELDLAYVIPWFLDVERVQGALNVNVRFLGTLASIKSEGEANIQRGEVEIGKGYGLSNIEGLVKFEPHGVNITGINAKVLGGNALFNGFVPYDNLQNFEIFGNFQDVVMPRFYGVTARGSGKVSVMIKDGYPFIKGDVKVAEANMDLGMLKDSIRKNIDVVKVYKGDVGGRDKDGVKDYAMEIFFDLSEAKAKVVGLGLHDEVHGKLWLVKAIGEPVALDGKIQHRKGWFEVNEAKIEISEGYALFKRSLDPELFLVATKKVRDIEITVHVMGRGSEPEIVMGSDPPMDKVDIVSYLLFDRPATNLTGREGLALQSQVATFLGSQASRILKKSIGDTPFTPDVIQMRESQSGQSSVIEIGKYVTPDFYVTYEKDLRSGGEDNVRMEYRLNRHFSLQTQVGSQNQSGVDLLWRYDFGK